MSKGFCGLKIELSPTHLCNECGKIILNEGALAVCRYRNSQGQQPTLFYHKDCLYKETMNLLNKPTNRGKCPLCDNNRGMDLSFKINLNHLSHSKKTVPSYGSYHKDCIDKFLEKNKRSFNLTDKAFGQAIENFKQKRFKIPKIKRVTQLDYLLGIINKYDNLNDCLNSNKIARKRFIIGDKNRLYDEYVSEHYKYILDLILEEEIFVPWKGISQILYQVNKNWKDLDMSVKIQATDRFIDEISINRVDELWTSLGEDIKMKFLSLGKVDIDFFNKHVRDKMKYSILQYNTRMSEEVRTIVTEDERILKRSW